MIIMVDLFSSVGLFGQIGRLTQENFGMESTQGRLSFNFLSINVLLKDFIDIVIFMEMDLKDLIRVDSRHYLRYCL